MNIFTVALTIAALAVCGPENNTIKEDLIFEKPAGAEKGNVIIYKKVPTKWIKTSKKSS